MQFPILGSVHGSVHIGRKLTWAQRILWDKMLFADGHGFPFIFPKGPPKLGGHNWALKDKWRAPIQPCGMDFPVWFRDPIPEVDPPFSIGHIWTSGSLFPDVGLRCRLTTPGSMFSIQPRTSLQLNVYSLSQQMAPAQLQHQASILCFSMLISCWACFFDDSSWRSLTLGDTIPVQYDHIRLLHYPFDGQYIWWNQPCLLWCYLGHHQPSKTPCLRSIGSKTTWRPLVVMYMAHWSLVPRPRSQISDSSMSLSVVACKISTAPNRKLIGKYLNEGLNLPETLPDCHPSYSTSQAIPIRKKKLHFTNFRQTNHLSIWLCMKISPLCDCLTLQHSLESSPEAHPCGWTAYLLHWLKLGAALICAELLEVRQLYTGWI